MYRTFGYFHAQLSNLGSSLDRRLKSQRGQGTVEYVALILVIALVMVGVVTAMKKYQTQDGQQLGDLILGKIKEAVNKVKY